MFQISKTRILIQIDKSAQRQKREKIGGIFLHPSFVFMDRNLQHGRVCQVGQKALQNYPYIEQGDTVFFHHTIEDGSERFIDRLDNGDELLWLDASDVNNNYEIYGVMKHKTGELIASRHYVWLGPNVTKLRKIISSESILIDIQQEQGEEDEGFIRRKIERLEIEKELLQPSLTATKDYTRDKEFDRRVEIVNQLNRIDKERQYLTAKLNERKVGIATAVAINSDISKRYAGIKPGGQVFVNLPLYPLDIYNAQNPSASQQFYTVRSSEILGYHA